MNCLAFQRHSGCFSFVTPAKAGVQLGRLQNEAGFRLSPE
jgi:hypothetical protein